MRRLERLADLDHRPLVSAEPEVAQVVLVVTPGRVERRAHRAAKPVGGHTLREAVHRDDPPYCERVGPRAGELGVLEAREPALQLDLARDDHLVSRCEAPLDEAAAEPDRLGLARAVAEAGDRPLDPAPKGRRNVERHHRDACRDRLLRCPIAERAERDELREVVVAARQVKEEIAHGLDAEPSQPARHRRRHEPRPRELGVGHDVRHRRAASRRGHATRWRARDPATRPR
jgi:hypothetical protein